MKVVHFSDWHAAPRNLPWADLYVCTGDMYPNFPFVKFNNGNREYQISKLNEEKQQREWIKKQPDSWREFLENKDAPLVLVRGNHDFIPLSELFYGDNTFEINKPTDVFEINGLKIGGCRGINFIQGKWSDELSSSEWFEVVEQIPLGLDILATHSPILGFLDQFPPGRCLGNKELSSYLIKRDILKKGVPKLALFGHVHESKGINAEYEDIIFSNAATTFNILEI